VLELREQPASAFPGFCPGGGGYGAFGYCDGPTYPDGSYDHTVMIFGGWQASRVCPPDPANPAIPLAWVPGQQCAFSSDLVTCLSARTSVLA
jgi:hypothetical protein